MRGSETLFNSLRVRKQPTISSSPNFAAHHYPVCVDAIAQDASACASAIQRCGESRALPDAHLVHGHILCHGPIHDHAHIESLLMNMYVKCGSNLDAICIFHHMHHPCVFAFNYAMKVYAKHGEEDIAFDLFYRMTESGVLPNQVTYTTILCMLSKSRYGVQGGRKLHIRIICSSFKDDVIIGTSLVNMYGKCDSTHDAERAFDAMIDPNLVTWTTMISLYAHHSSRHRALQAFTEVFLQGLLPNRVSFLSILSACTDPACLADGKRIHAIIVCTEVQPDISLMNALVSMYGRCGSLDEARRFFNVMHEYDIISYSSIIAFYSQQYKVREVMELLEGMKRNGITPNDVTFINILGAFSTHEMLDKGRIAHKQVQEYGLDAHLSVANAIVAMYGRCWSLEDAYQVFEKIHFKDVASWNSIIGASVEQGQVDMAFSLFEEMQRKMCSFPDIFTFTSLLKACTSSQALNNAMLLHACICEDGLEHTVDIGTSLVNMYNKCNDLKDAQRVFDRMPKRNRILWNSIISANVHHGKLELAHQLFDRMVNKERIIPDKITIVIILGACVRSKDLSKGKELHKFLLDHSYTIDEMIGSSLINMYGKCGDIEGARDVFENIGEGANLVSWTSMMREYVESDQGEKALKLYGQMIDERIHVIPDAIAFTTILTACTNQSALDDGKCVHAWILESGLDGVIDVGNAIVNMYGKCGCAKSAWVVFNALREHDIFSWNSLLAVYAQHGLGEEVLHLVGTMEAEHVRPDKVTLSIVLTACSHGGFIHEGYKFFMGMSEGYYIDLQPCEDHFLCVIDLLGRAGLVDVARHYMIHYLPFQPTPLAYTMLLAACQLYDVDWMAQEDFFLPKCIIELDPETSASYVILSNTFALMESKS